MKFELRNIEFINSGLSVRWSLVGFMFIILFILGYVLSNKIRKRKCLKVNFDMGNIQLNVFIALSTVVVYFFRALIGDNGKSIFYKLAEFLVGIDVLMVIGFLAIIIYSLVRYKNEYTFVNLYLKVLSVFEIIYLISYFITNKIHIGMDLFGVIVSVLLIIFVFLNAANLEFISNVKSNDNPQNAIDSYDFLFASRKKQADEIVDIIEESESKYGRSICINGKWGVGKTSFINGVLDKLVQDKKNSKTKVNIHEIRINAMELDDSASMINYFFNKIEEILKENKIYVGIASEYKELVASISGTIVHESVGDFLSNKLNSNSDYRENIDNLRELLVNNLYDSRIVIIIDDIERCSAEKAKSFVFLIKEIATMNLCITIFLVDIDKFREICVVDEFFLEKFFNYTFSLVTVNYDDILLYLKENCTDMHEMLNKYKEKIEVCEKDLLNSQDNQGLKEKTQKHKESFFNDLSNPRSLNKSIEYYKRLKNKVDENINECVNTNRKILAEEFIKKVEYRKQLSLLAIIYGLYGSEFAEIQKDGIYNYVEKLRLDNSRQEKNTYWLLCYKWFTGSIFSPLFKYEHITDFMIKEILRFVNCVLADVSELVNISNGYSSEEEKYISSIKEGRLPDNISFTELIEKIYHATYDRLDKRDEIIQKIFELYKRNIVSKQVDEVFDLFSKKFMHSIGVDIMILQKLADVFCVDEYYVSNVAAKLAEFMSFARNYSHMNIGILNAYLVPILQSKNFDQTWEKLTGVLFSQMNYKDGIKRYCKQCEDILNLSEPSSEIDIMIRLDNIISKAKEKYNELEMSESPDVIKAYENVENLMKEIKCFSKIEEFINKKDSTEETFSFTNKILTTENISNAISELNDDELKNEGREGYIAKYINEIFKFICDGENNISNDDFDKLSKFTQKYYERYNELYNVPIVDWRIKLVYIKRNKVSN